MQRLTRTGHPPQSTMICRSWLSSACGPHSGTGTERRLAGTSTLVTTHLQLVIDDQLWNKLCLSPDITSSHVARPGKEKKAYEAKHIDE